MIKKPAWAYIIKGDTLKIFCYNIADRIKEQKLAERRGWKIIGTGFNDDGLYYVELERKSKSLKQRKKKGGKA